jgi:betaine-aldehyde dehydrogenase
MAIAPGTTPGLFHSGGWHEPIEGGRTSVFDPTTGDELARVAEASSADVDAAVDAARAAFPAWRSMPPTERAGRLREVAAIIRSNADELATLDARNGGNPVGALRGFMEIAAESVDFFAGLVTELKGDTIPMGEGRLNVTVREPMGVVARITAFNHPLMFTASRLAAPLAAGNTVIMKPPVQDPLSALRLAELVGDVFPPGVLSVLTGGAAVGDALARHRGVAAISLIGSVGTGRAVMQAAAETLKPVVLELGGKNALVADRGTDPDRVAAACIDGMNLAWAGQSCGSTSRAFLHDDIHDAVVERLADECARFRPGIPIDPATTMGALVSRAQHDRVLSYIHTGLDEGARLVTGGRPPDDPALVGGWFVEPTIFTDVTPSMTIAREEIFGPVLSVLRWNDESRMLRDVNALDYGLTAAIWTNDLERAMRWATTVEAGFVWVNEVAKHFVGAPFGGVKQSGIGREESIAELYAFTEEKNVHIRFRPEPTSTRTS